MNADTLAMEIEERGVTFSAAEDLVDGLIATEEAVNVGGSGGFWRRPLVVVVVGIGIGIGIGVVVVVEILFYLVAEGICVP